VCSAECRAARRRGQAKRRRAQDLEGHRQAERERQRARRQERRGAPPRPTVADRRVTPPPPSRAPSRAGFGAQLRETAAEILLFWDKAAELSRASLERDLTRILGESAPLVGQVGQPRAGCHAPGGARNPGKSMGEMGIGWDRAGADVTHRDGARA
jgi:hypothetical protein